MVSGNSTKIIHFKGKKEADDWLFTSARMLEILATVDDYLEWIKTKDSIERTDSFFEGYKLASGLVFGVIVDRLSSSFLLDLEKDFRIQRVNFVGADIDDLPNYSDSILALKMLNRRYKKIFHTETWKELKDIIGELLPIIAEIRTHFIKDIKGTNKKVKKQKMLDLTTLNNMHYFFDVDDQGRPMFWVHNVSTTNTPIRTTHRAYIGYISAFEFIVSRLSVNKSIQESYAGIVAQIDTYKTKSENYYHRESRGIIDGFFHRDDNSDLVPWIAFHLWIEDKWSTFSKNVRRAYGMGLDTKPYFIYNKKSKIIFNVDQEEFSEPDYFVKNDYKSISKRLEYYLYWYNFSLIDSCGYGTFNGVPAFTSILYGYSKLRVRKDNLRSIKVIIFKHPEEGLQDAHRISLGILVELVGIFSDSSGWLIFNNCATDFSGTGNSLYNQALDVINELESEGLVESATYEVNLEPFEKYLKENKFENKIAIEESSFMIDAADGISTEEIEKTGDEKTECEQIRQELVEYKKRIALTREILANMRHSNLLISQVINTSNPFFVINPELAVHLILPCKNEDDFEIRIGHLAKCFDSDCRPIIKLLEEPNPMLKSIGALKEWNLRKNNNRIPSNVIDTWYNINRLRNNLPSFHESKKEFCDIMNFFGVKHPIEYGLFWEKIEASFSRSLIEFMVSMNPPLRNN